MLFVGLKDDAEISVEEEKPDQKKKKREHNLEKKDRPSHNTRKYCKGCYQKKINSHIHKNRVKKVSIYCLDYLDF